MGKIKEARIFVSEKTMRKSPRTPIIVKGNEGREIRELRFDNLTRRSFWGRWGEPSSRSMASPTLFGRVSALVKVLQWNQPILGSQGGAMWRHYVSKKGSPRDLVREITVEP